MSGIADPLPHAGAGVVLRRLSTADLPAFQAYRTDAELGRYQGWVPMSDEAARAFLDEMNSVPLFRPGKWTQIAVAGPEGVALLGDIGLCLAENDSHAEIGFTLAREAQGRGLATMAVRAAIQLVFNRTAAQQILGVTDARNRASIAVLERVGMHRQEERAAVFRAEPCIEYVYVLPRSDG